MEIKFNTEMHRWEVYGPASVVRNGELQPLFVSDDLAKIVEYMGRVKREH